MRPETARGERAFEVRAAARTWRRAGTIDDGALAAIETAHADDRVRARLAFRVLFFAFAAFAVFSAFGLVLVSGFDSGNEFGIASLLFAGACIVLTEIQTGRMRRDRGGTEEATAFAATIFLIAAAFWFVFEVMHVSPGRFRTTLILALCAAILTGAAWRWAHLVAAVAAAACFFWLLARAPYGRWLWAIAGGLAIAPLLRASVSARLAPSHRRACAAVLFVALLALYGAVSIWSFDHGVVERIGDRLPGYWRLFSGWSEPEIVPTGLSWTLVRVVHVLLTALLPLALIVAGISARRRILLDTGALLAAISLATVRAYLHLADTWLILTAAGGALIATALLLQRALDRAPRRERRGFTAEPLFTNPAHEGALKVAAAVVSFTPEARRLPSEQPGAEGKGGASGGAGAGGEF